ncbi:YjbF family lipoprotein [Luteibacter sp. NPDC031894]|uniref:YjbF family lipoprotein n=1 Tax=Luteibacter sp. NPDC031894 TaxID=3390572 RepID=UPI003D033C71
MSMRLVPRSILAGSLGLVFASLAACSSVSRGSLEAVRLAMRRESVHPTAASVAETPYFQLQANGPDGEAILVLARVENGVLGWYGTGHDIVFTRDGVVVKTVGLPQNLDGSAIQGTDPFRDGLQHLTGPLEYARRVDWSPGYRYGVVLKARLEPKALEDVEILGTVHHLRRIDEHVSAPALGLSLTNRYWIDPSDGFIWKSRQYVAPGLPLELIQLQPYREASS